MRLCELQQKEVINVSNCKCLGHIMDIEFCEKDGRITAVIIPGPGKLLGCFGRDFEYVIPWCKIIRIGPDIILVDVCEEDAKRK